jgi:hypothetical protein
MRINIMLRLLAKWYISRLIDCDRAMPAWVERWVARDPSLQQFFEQSQRLAARFRATESTPPHRFVEESYVGIETPARVASARPNFATARFATFSVGLAATAVLAMILFLNQSIKDRSGSAPDIARVGKVSGSKSYPVEANQIDPAQMRELIASGESLVQSLKQRLRKTAEPAIGIDYARASALVDLDVNQVIKPVSDLGSGYGELLLQFDHHVEEENRRIISDGISSWHFFVNKLPRSAASLAGL